MSKQEELNKLKNQILADNPSPELAAGAKQLVFGDGNPDSKLLFIGEAPGKKEDEQGIPFVGAAGKFLTEMLSSIGMKRDDIYITNIVKYRPPENRDPSTEEKLAFLPYLKKQIAIIAPKIIVTLGRHSGMAFLPELYMSGDHGQPKRIRVLLENIETKLVILPLYHPAAALYNGGLRNTLLEDFSVIPELLKKIESKN
ncbi:MAG: uracil-DNA glycosylase [bacterium]|nr:uracil-DNA glycosylase [bacterium]